MTGNESYIRLITLLVLIHVLRSTAQPASSKTSGSPTVTSNDHTTSTIFKTYLLNPSDFTTVLLIIGGDIVRKALAQLSGSGFAPVAFSFGWVAYAFSALASVVGDGKLMPMPEFSSVIINVNSGFIRNNDSWTLARVLRDLELKTVRRRGGLSVTVLHTVGKGGVPKRDWVWFLGMAVIPLQLGMSIIPWVSHDNWSIFFLTACGTALALCTTMLPQWASEKWDGDRRLTGSYCLTRGNGNRHVFLIQNQSNEALNLEDMATSHVRLSSSAETYSRICLGSLALLWVVFIICAGALQKDVWFLLAIGYVSSSCSSSKTILISIQCYRHAPKHCRGRSSAFPSCPRYRSRREDSHRG